MTKCNNCRFKAEISNSGPISGRIKVEESGVYLVDGQGNYIGFLSLDGEEIISVSGCSITDFEIVLRDPGTYRDWQVGDKVWDSYESGNNGRIIFRSGDFVAADIDGCTCYTCEELFDDGYRLVLTDIEQQIIEGETKYEPQDGDVCFVKTAAGNCFIFIKRDHKSDEEIHSYACFDTNFWSLCSAKVSCVCDRQSIRELRPATENEKQLLFDAMAKDGKRWNAEKKVVEDILKPHEFRKGEPVLVRTDYGRDWVMAAYVENSSNPDAQFGKYGATDGRSIIFYRFCIPYNERTMHLLGTSEDYKEDL